MKKLFVTAVLAASLASALAGSLCACSVSSSSTSHASFSASYTDENGETKEKSVSFGYDAGIGDTEDEQDEAPAEDTEAEDADVAAEETDEPSDEEIGANRRAFYADTFEYGAEGFNADGDAFFFAYDDPDDVTRAALIMISATDKKDTLYVIGDVVTDDEGDKIVDDYDENLTLLYFIEDPSGENDFDLVFRDGDTAQMNLVEKDQIVEDMNTVIDMARANGEAPLVSDLFGNEEEGDDQGVWTVTYNPDLFEVTEENGTTNFVYTGESAGTNMVSITYLADASIDDVLEEKTAAFDEAATQTFDGEYMDTGRRCVTVDTGSEEEGNGERMSVTAIECAEGTLCLETVTHNSGDDAIDIPVSDAIADIFDSLQIND